MPVFIVASMSLLRSDDVALAMLRSPVQAGKSHERSTVASSRYTVADVCLKPTPAMKQLPLTKGRFEGALGYSGFLEVSAHSEPPGARLDCSTATFMRLLWSTAANGTWGSSASASS